MKEIKVFLLETFPLNFEEGELKWTVHIKICTEKSNIRRPFP